MKITILDGNPNPDNQAFTQFLDNLRRELGAKGHETTLLQLRDMDIKYCTGCFGCWVKNPGQCVFPDQVDTVCREMMAAHLVLMASPLIMGFVSALLKKTMDRLIPLLLPYLELVENECHHVKRYSHYPLLGLVLDVGNTHKHRGPEGFTEEITEDIKEDIKITTDIFKRMALNLRTRFQLVALTRTPVQEVVNEINHI